jgi:hypothetical protein
MPLVPGFSVEFLQSKSPLELTFDEDQRGKRL